VFCGREPVRNSNKKNTPPPNRYFYYEDPHFISTEYSIYLKNNVANQYIYIDNNLIFLKPRILNTQKISRRPDITLRENIIEELRLRG